MCQFVSVVERRGHTYFLTGEQLFKTAKGKEFCKTISRDDYCGHGTIRAWYGIDAGDGIDKEYTDFSSPKNFPPEIVEAIKKGKMRGLGEPRQLLTASAWKTYQEVLASAWKTYYEATASTRKAYQEALASAGKAYQEALASAGKDCEATASAWKAYQEATASARKDCEATASAWKTYQEAVSKFWSIFAIPENRGEVWR